MNAKSLIPFTLGLVLGACLLFGIERLPQIGAIFRSPAEVMQMNLPGHWQGSVDLNGNQVDFSMNVKNDGKSLSGVLNSPRVGDVPCDQLQVDAMGNITFSAHLQDKSMSFTGKVAPDAQSMTGTFDGSIGTGMWSLAKSKS
jgi:hypothetical protein